MWLTSRADHLRIAATRCEFNNDSHDFDDTALLDLKVDKASTRGLKTSSTPSNVQSLTRTTPDGLAVEETKLPTTGKGGRLSQIGTKVEPHTFRLA